MFKIGGTVKKLGTSILAHTNIKIWATLHTGQKLKVDFSSPVGRSIYFRKRYEPEVEAYLRKTLLSGDIFIDVGANVGYFTLIASELVGESGEVYCFEPHHEVYRLLSLSVEANQLKNVYAANNALWNKSQTLSFDHKKNSAFSHIIFNANTTIKQLHQIQAIALDDFSPLRNKSKIKVIKIDIEGAEYQALLGMEKILKSCQPHLIIELTDWSLAKFGNRTEEIFDFLQQLNYKVFDLAKSSISSFEEAQRILEKSWVKNLVFEHE